MNVHDDGHLPVLGHPIRVFESLELLLLVVFATGKPERAWESLMSAGVGRGLAGACPDRLLFRGLLEKLCSNENALS